MMKNRFHVFLALLALAAMNALAQQPSATIPAGTDLYNYFQNNSVTGDNQSYDFVLDPGGQYTVSAPLEFNYCKVTLSSADAGNPATITFGQETNIVTGNSLKLQHVNIDASQTGRPLIALYNYEAAPDGILDMPQNFYMIDCLCLTGCNISGVQGSLIYDNGKNYCVRELTIDDCVVQMNTVPQKVKNQAFISFQGGGAKDFTIRNSTVYQTGEPLKRYFMRYSHIVRADRITGSRQDYTTFNYINNTFYRVLDENDGQWFNGNGVRDYSMYKIQANIWVDADNGQTARRIMGGYLSAYSVAGWRYNTYWKDGEAKDQSAYDDSGTALTTDPGFVDPASGNFTITGAQQLQYGTGDSRWGGWITEIVFADVEIGGLAYRLDGFTMTAAVLPSRSPDANGDYLYTQERIDIPSQVTYNGKVYEVNEIRNDAFARCPNLTTVTIPTTVTKFGSGIFANCPVLSDVTLPERMTEIPSSMFRYCRALTHINIPSTVTVIGAQAFSDDRYLTELNLPAGLRVIRSRAFYYCTGLQSLTLSQGLNTIESGAFSYCSGLQTVTLPQGLETIGEYAFEDCKLTQVDVPESVTTIGDRAFYGVQQAINVDAANANYCSQDGVLFDKAKTTLLQAPLMLSGIYNVPTTVTIIGTSAFRGCVNLAGVILPAGLTTIESGAFSYTGLTGYVDVPASVSNDFWFDAFRDCPNLRGLNIAEGNPVASSDQGVVYNKEKTQLLMMTEGFEGAYSILPTTQSIGIWEYDEQMQTYRVVSSGIISDCAKLTALHIPASVMVITGSSLRRNPQLATITVDEDSPYFTTVDGVLFDKQVKTLYWFPEPRGGSYVIPDGVEALAASAFVDAVNLSHIVVPASVNKLGYRYGIGNELFNCFTLDAITWLRDEPLGGDDMAYSYEYEWSYNNDSLGRAFCFYRPIDEEPYEEWASCTLYVPDGSVETYKSHPQWGALGFDIQPISLTGITETVAAGSEAKSSTACFSLSGQRLAAPKKGVNIIGGKKVVVK